MVEGGAGVSGTSFIRASIPSLILSPKVLISKCPLIGDRFSTYEFKGHKHKVHSRY